MLVALGIDARWLAGLGRETVASRLLGNSADADAFAVAMRIPNLMSRSRVLDEPQHCRCRVYGGWRGAL